MKKCLMCGQKNGIKDSHKFCHNCGGNLFEVEIKKIIVGAVKKEKRQIEQAQEG